MGLRHGAEKPAAVRWLLFAAGWLPALAFGVRLHPAMGPAHVLDAAGSTGVEAGWALAASLALLTAAYVTAIRRPPAAGPLLAAVAASLLAALAIPILFSADIYAYAYYGDLALHGRNPYGHDFRAADDPLSTAARAAWSGHIPPRCVYGPVAVAIAAIADRAGAGGGVAGQILAGRLAAAVAYAACCAGVLRLWSNPRARAVLLLNPVVLWSVAEGHNDAAMLALIFAGLTLRGRWRALSFALAVLVKAPALLMWTRIARGRTRLAASVLVGLGYAPLGFALLAESFKRSGLMVLGSPMSPSGASAWQSPLGLAAADVGRIPALGLTLVFLAAVALAMRRLPAAERTPALALAAWFALPNAYPWYALWIVPLAARNVSSLWARALIVAALAAPARAIADAVFAEADGSASHFHLALMAAEYLPPLGFVGWALVRRAVLGRRARALVVIAAVVASCSIGLPANGQSTAPIPSAAPQTAPAATTPAAGPATSAPAPNPTAAPPPAAMPSSLPPAPAASATPTPTPPTLEPATPPPAALPPPPAAPPAPTPTPTPNPFNYIINPVPVPATTPDGPHILQIDLNDRRIRAGGPLLVRVFTSPNVVGVEARALGRFIAIPQSSPGLFALAYTMPDMIPFWLLNKNYDIVIAAATADGRQITVSFPMLLTR